MIGWIVAAAVFLLAAIVIWRLRSQLDDQSGQTEELRTAWHQSQEELEQQRSNAALGRMLGDLAPSLVQEATVPAAPPEKLVQTIVDYRRRIHDYDSAVQYCLQPVELMPGADEEDLDKLLEHVTGARKRLFEARAALIEDDMLQRLPEVVQQAVGQDPADDLVGALATVATAGRGEHAIELGEVLDSALLLTRARNAQGPELKTELAELPVLPPWPWLAPSLVNLLQLGMRGSARDTPAQFGARFVQQSILIRFRGLRADDDAGEQEAVEAALFDLQQRLDEHGLSLALGGDDKRMHEFTLHIPLPAGEPVQP